MSADKNKKIYFVTGGGTGGHIYPAIAIAKALREETSTQKIYFVGNPDNLEAKIAAQEGFEFLPVNVKSMPRKFDFDFVKWGFGLDKAIFRALTYIYRYKPNAIFGTGGYVSAPAVIAAYMSKTPYMIHDSDSHPGIVSRYVSRGAKVVSVAFEEAKNFLDNSNLKILGNPIKKEFFELSKQQAKEMLKLDKNPALLVMGGSQGAMNINHTVANCLKYFSEELKINTIIQTGEKHYEGTIEHIKKIYPEYEKRKNIIVKPYFENMSIPLIACDIAVSRAGSLSLSEIAATNTASILVPFPYAAADHQRKNAKCYEEAGAAIYIDDFELNKEKLQNAVTQLIKHTEIREEMAKRAGSFAKPNATADIVKNLMDIAK